jgi:hypothetical protein
MVATISILREGSFSTLEGVSSKYVVQRESEARDHDGLFVSMLRNRRFLCSAASSKRPAKIHVTRGARNVWRGIQKIGKAVAGLCFPKVDAVEEVDGC